MHKGHDGVQAKKASVEVRFVEVEDTDEGPLEIKKSEFTIKRTVFIYAFSQLLGLDKQ